MSDPTPAHDPRFAILAGRVESTAVPVAPDCEVCTVFVIGDDDGLYSAFLTRTFAERLRAGQTDGQSPAAFVMQHEVA